MTPIGVLSPRLVRDYLRGINLGAAWQGPSADATIMTLFLLEVAKAEAIMGIHFHRSRILCLPPATFVQGTDYDTLQLPIPYVAPVEGQTAYRLTLHLHDVQAITQVRLVTGMSASLPAQPLFQTVDLADLIFSSYHEALFIPVEVVAAPPALAWAVDYLQGLGALPPEVVTWCALGAAMQVLGLAGSAADVSGGVDATSLEMDGIRETITYGIRGQAEGGGLYAGPIGILRAQRDDLDLSKLRFRYQNVQGDTTTIPPGALLPSQPYEQTVCLPRRAPLPV